MPRQIKIPAILKLSRLASFPRSRLGIVQGKFGSPSMVFTPLSVSPLSGSGNAAPSVLDYLINEFA